MITGNFIGYGNDYHCEFLTKTGSTAATVPTEIFDLSHNGYQIQHLCDCFKTSSTVYKFLPNSYFHDSSSWVGQEYCFTEPSISIGIEDFTVDMWFAIDVNTGEDYSGMLNLFTTDPVESLGISSTSSYISLQSGDQTMKMVFYLYPQETPLVNSAVTIYDLGGISTYTAREFHHMSFNRYRNNVYMTYDGEIVDLVTTIGIGDLNLSFINFGFIGATALFESKDNFMSYYVDEFRFSKGICRYPLSGNKGIGYKFPVPNRGYSSLKYSGKNWYIEKISAGGQYSLYYGKIYAYTSSLWSWGYNSYGELGDNQFLDRSLPVSVLGTQKNYYIFSAGGYHSFGIDREGQVWGWGRNDYGQLGIDSTVSRSTPVSILGIKKTFCQISSKWNLHSTGIDAHGRVWAWGYNNNGQLGIYSVVSKRTPVSILGVNKTFCKISGAGYHSTGIDNHGMIWGWGYNGTGQLGINIEINKSTPVSIMGVKKTFCSISCGGLYTMALDYHEGVWTWGDNSYGQLGDNTTMDKCTPVKIMEKGVRHISAGYDHALFISREGTLYSWGRNYWGQLGINSVTDRSIPTSIHGIKKTFCQISAGSDHSLALDYEDQLWGWGYNIRGQIGDGTVISKRTPVMVCV